MTVDDLVSKVKLWAAVPNQQPAFTDAQFRELLTDELHSVIVPIIMSNNEEFFVRYIDYTITTGVNEYIIPKRAVANILREVKQIQGDDSDADNWTDVPRVELTDREKYEHGFIVYNNYIWFINPADYNGYTLRLYYYERPNNLISPTTAAEITAINGNTLTVSSVPSNFTSGQNFDIIQGSNPYTILDTDSAGTISGADITFSSVPRYLAVGDYVAESFSSPVANIPEEVQPLLVQGVVIKVMEILNDPRGTQLAAQKYRQLRENIRNLMSPRVTGEVKKITNNYSMLEE